MTEETAKTTFGQILKDTLQNNYSTAWDIIVLSACDNEQASGYEVVLQQKYKDSNILQRFNVIADPPNCKIGNGGSTIHVILTLFACLGEKLFEKRVLLIHAGGYSGRMPTATIQGKVFTHIPSRISSQLHMLDVKLALTAPFALCMPPGFFVTCSDDVEPYTLPVGITKPFRFGQDFTAIAHPTQDWHLASQHGVYLEDPENPGLCMRVLQKASVERLKNSIPSGNILIDSMFSFSHRITRLLLTWVNDHPNWTQVEIDAYGDFLQALGSQPSQEYIETTRDSVYKKIRKSIFDILSDSSLHLIVLEDSYFVHIGTNREYLDNLTRNDDFIRDMEILQDVQIACSFVKDSHIARNSIVEFCKFSCPIEIGEDSIISNCYIENYFCRLVLPKDLVMHTIPVIVPSTEKSASTEKTSFITILFNINDNAKSAASAKEKSSQEIIFMGAPLNDHLTRVNRTIDEVFGVSVTNFTLWKAKLFPLAETPTESIFISLSHCCPETLITIVEHQGEGILHLSASRMFFSLDEILRIKDLPYMFKMKAECY